MSFDAIGNMLGTFFELPYRIALSMGLPFSSAVVVTYLVWGFVALFLIWRLVRMLRRKPATTDGVGAAVSGLTAAAMEELERAQALLKQGAITPLEYERMKAKILGM